MVYNKTNNAENDYSLLTFYNSDGSIYLKNENVLILSATMIMVVNGVEFNFPKILKIN